MLGLTLRKEFQGRRLRGTAIELANRNRTGATQIAASEFLRITYPSGDVLDAIEAIGPQPGGISHRRAAQTAPEGAPRWHDLRAQPRDGGRLMPLPLALLRRLQEKPPAEAWAEVFKYAWEICSVPIHGKAKTEINERSRLVGAVDLFLATAGWDLWQDYLSDVPRTADALADWWVKQGGARAVLILDGLSLREAPWILDEAQKRGYSIHEARAAGAELPADTTPFANALGLPSRSSLANDAAPKNHRLAGARTDTVDLPWEDCVALISSDPSWVLWHHWPDERVHDLDGYGKGIDILVDEAREKLTSDAFWKLVERLTTGRRLVITADHGYAASGRFPDVTDAEQIKYLMRLYKVAPQNTAQTNHSQARERLTFNVVSARKRRENRGLRNRRPAEVQNGVPTRVTQPARG